MICHLCRHSLWILILAFLVAGCSVGMGDRVGDFRAYYNTFYNAERAFEEATEDLSLEREELSQSRFTQLRPGPSQITRDDLLEDAIASSADILRDHSNSRWVYPALMLIGKSYFYQENYAGAEQNFREVIERDETRRSEAHAWLARTLMEAGEFGDALDHVDLHRGGVSDDHRADLELTAAEIHVRQRNWAQAASSLLRALDENPDRLTRAHAHLLLGQVREAQHLYPDAGQAYGQARQLRASMQSELHALIGQTRVQAENGEHDTAVEMLERTIREQRFMEHEDELRYWQGHILMLANQVEEAIAKWEELLYDEELNPSPNTQARTHHALGELFRDEYQDYARAAEHFELASQATDIEEADSPWLTVHAMSGSAVQADRFAEVAEVTNRMNHLDSLLTLGEMDEASFQALAAERREARIQEVEEARQTATAEDQWNMAGGVTEGVASTEDAAESAGDAGFLFYRDPSRVQEIRTRFNTRWGDRPHVRNWRRQSAITASAQTPPGVIDDLLIEEDVSQEMHVIDAELGLDEVPRDEASRAAMRQELAEAQYQLGNALFLSVERPDSALYWYDTVLESEDAATIQHRARYAKAEALSALNREQEARSFYEQVARQSDHSDLARRAAERLGEVDVADEEEALTPEDHYQQAYDQWQVGERPEALDELLRIYESYADSRAARRSLWAAGHIALEMAQHQQAPLTRARQWIPDTLRTTSSEQAAMDELIGLAHASWLELVETYPESREAGQARHLTSYLNEPARRRHLAQRLTFGEASAEVVLDDPPEIPADDAQGIAEEEEEEVADVPVAVSDLPEEPEEAFDESAAPDPPEVVELTPEAPLGDGESVWGIVVGSGFSQSDAEAEEAHWTNQGYHAEVIEFSEDDGEIGYWVAVGRIESLDSAQELLEAYEVAFPDDSWLLNLSADPLRAEFYTQEEPEEAFDESATPDPPEAAELTPGGPLGADESGWVIVVDSGSSEPDAESERAYWSNQGFRAEVLEFSDEDGNMGYRVVLGRIESRGRAQDILEAYEDTFPDDSWLLNFSSERN